MADRVSAGCPREGCDGTVAIPKDLPAGTYPCVCHATQVRLSWTTMANFERVPMLAVAEPQDGGDAPGHDLDLLKDACRYAVRSTDITAERIQRNVRVGHVKARRLVSLMASWGVVDPAGSGAKARAVLVTEADLPALFERMDAASEEVPHA